MGYDADKMRAALRKQMGGRQQDPNEFRAPKASEGQTLKYRFHILPPISEGDTILGGTATRGMDTFCVPDGLHWVDNKPHSCPRVMTNDELDCEMCSTGFMLLNEVKANGNDESARKNVKDSWLPNTNRIVNIWFPPLKSNPEELHNRVMWFKANASIFQIWSETLMRDGPGDDEEEPLPYGIFFDENDSLIFNLIVTKDKQYNGYKTSKFIVRDAKGNPDNGPLVRKSDGSPDTKAIKAILAQRHDLYSKQEPYDVVAISKLANRLLGESNGDDGYDVDETTSKAKPNKKPAAREEPASVRRSTTPTAKTTKPAKPPVDDSDNVEVPTSELVGDALEDDDDTTTVIKSRVTTKATVKTAPAETEEDDGEDDDLVKNLLDQMDDDD